MLDSNARIWVNEEIKIKKALDSDTLNIPFPQLDAAIIFFMPMTIFVKLLLKVNAKHLQLLW